MSTFLRNKKESEHKKLINQILDKEFNSNPAYLKEAEKKLDSNIAAIKKYKVFNNILSSIKTNTNTIENKTTNIDFINKNMCLCYSAESISILGYSLGSLSNHKIFPVNISSLFNKNINFDINRSKTVDEIEKIRHIETFLKNFYSKYNLTVNRIQKDTNNGIIYFETNQIDAIFGTSRQYISIKLDSNKIFSIKNIKDNLKNLSNDYKSLFSFFMLFGFSDIYAKCSCKNYMSKYNKKLGIQNYLCNHILYSMSMFPYYATSILYK